ncbi:MAG: deoxyribonuclease IV [Pseudonocardiales bacterium]|nr:MAG: deoxyribonuclease IV [Pseudonocardiales bacterium]
MRIGVHIDQTNPLKEAAVRGVDVVQFFLGDPQAWPKHVPVREDAATLRESAVALYVHAPYVINVATTNNRIRIPSRKMLGQQAAAAAAIGAKGLIVHGGHVLKGDLSGSGDPDIGVDNWRKTLEREAFPLPILIENTAGGDYAMARRLDRLARLWDAIGDYEVGFCLDTCHFHAAGEDLGDIVDRVTAITGRIDLVHANNSRDAFGSGADRHANLEDGQIDPAAIVAVIKAAGAPAILETPGEGHLADIAFLREHLPA